MTKMIIGPRAPSSALGFSAASIKGALPNTPEFDALVLRLTAGAYDHDANDVKQLILLQKLYYGLKSVYLNGALTDPLREKLDVGCFVLGNSADSRTNFTSADYGMATLTGGSFSSGQGFVLDGVDDYLDLDYEPTGSAPQVATLTDMHFSILITAYAGTDGDPIFGRLSGNDTLRFTPTASSGTAVSYRLGSETSHSTPYTGDPTGHWLVTRTGTTVRLYRNGVQLDEKTADTATALPGPLSIGRQGAASYHAATVGGWTVGEHLTTPEIKQLDAVMRRNQTEWLAIS